MFHISLRRMCCHSVSKLCLTPCSPWTAACLVALTTLSARDWSNSCPLHQCFYLTISFSAPSHPTTFSSCLQSFPASGSFSVSWLFTPGGQRIGASASAPFLSMNIHGWVTLELTDFLAVQWTLKSLLQHRSLKTFVL